MRFLELRLIAFGPFVDQVLDLSSAGLHVIYGPNEAGKSTALRAITGLLFGIPRRTTDDHLHAKKDLLLGARLLDGQGQVLEVLRRKGDKNTLLDPAGKPIDEAVLARVLGGVTEPQFLTMFGLDHESLRAGGEALLRGEGDVGESLFDAGGASGIGEVLRQLTDEADSLFKPAGRKPLLNEALARYKEAKAAVQDGETSPRAYLEQQKRLVEIQAEQEARVARQHELRAEQRRLNRALRVLPQLGKRRELLERLRELGHTPRLSRDAADRRRRVEAELDRLTRDVERLEAAIAELIGRQDAIAVPEPLARIEPSTMSLLGDQLGRHRAAMRDLPSRRGELRALEEQAQRALDALGRGRTLADAGALRLDRGSEARIEALIDRQGALITALEAAVRAQQLAVTKREAARQRLAALPPPADPTALSAAVRRATRAGDLDEAVAEARARLGQAEEALARALESLNARAGQGLSSLQPAPERSRVVDHAERSREAEQRRAELERRIDELTAADAALGRDLDELDLAGEVPSEDRLAELRSERERRWRPLEEALRRGAPHDPAPFRQALDEADALADRLRREADRVAKRARLLADRKATEAALERARQDREQHREREAALAAEWKALWAPLAIEPGSPREMLAWLDRHARVLELDEARRASEAALQDAERRRARHAGALRELIDDPPEGAELTPLLDRAEPLARRLEDTERQRAELKTMLAELEREVTLQTDERSERERALAAWRREWADAIAPLGLEPHAQVEEARAVLQGLRELGARVDKCADMRRRVDGIERDAAAFADTVAQLCAQHAADLVASGSDPAQAAEALLERWRRARRDDEERGRLAADIARQQQELAQARAERDAAEQQLAALLRDARAASLEQLMEAEQRSEELHALEARLAEIENDLLTEGGGHTLEELEASTQGIDADEARERLPELEDELDALTEEIKAGERQFESTRAGLETIRQKRGAFAAKLDEQACLASVRHHAERYLRVRLAGLLLEREIERYRQQNQDPILARARELFPRLTLGHYRDLKVGFGPGDEPELMCVRDGAEVRVSGLSDGTRDQLYLALRLASLERHGERGDAMPLVLDDVLIHFDDERASAALQVLAELGDRMQILFFTHQAKLLELARHVIGDRFTEHHLLGPVARRASPTANKELSP